VKVKIDRELCTGDAICAELCPNVFEIDNEGLAIVILEEVPEDLEEDVEEAAESCPEECIFIEND
jgi:ferredoxin